MSLERLSTELVGLILGSVDSPTDLHRLVSASPRCFSVFRLLRPHTLASVLANSTPAAVLHHLVGVVHAPRFADCHLPPAEHAQKVSSFLNKYLEGDGFQLPKDEDTIVRLLRLHLRVSTWVSRFVSDAVKRVEEHKSELAPGSEVSRRVNIIGPPSAPKKSVAQPPSKTEEMRLKRAFLRFEIYCRIFPIDPNHAPESLYSADEQFDMFLSRLAPWEVEEMTSIHQYYASIVVDVVAESGERFMRCLRASRSLCTPCCDDAQPDSEVMSQLLGLELSDLTFYSWMGPPQMADFISFITSIGLDFFHEVVHANEVSRHHLIRQHTCGMRDFLPEALQDRDLIHGFRLTTLQSNDPNDNDPSHANFGYRSFNRMSEDAYLGVRHNQGSLPLRRLGYVFWDSERFHGDGWMEAFRFAKRMDRDEEEKRFAWPRGLPIEERFKGSWIRRDEFQRLQEQFGDKYSWFQLPCGYDTR